MDLYKLGYRVCPPILPAIPTGDTVRPAASLYATVKSPLATVSMEGDETEPAGPEASTVKIVPVTSPSVKSMNAPDVGVRPTFPLIAEDGTFVTAA